MSQEKSSQPEKAANEVHQHFRGVFSSQELRKVGTGTTTRKTVTKTFWYAEEEPDGRLYVQPINSNYVPTGNKKYITKDELLAQIFTGARILYGNSLPQYASPQGDHRPGRQRKK